MRILFSPIGGTDPISESNYYEGALVHICRYYQPDKVYMYMSKEICAKQDEDGRYTYFLDHLMEEKGFRMTYEMIRRPELNEVQDFNFFFQEFRSCLLNIFREMKPDDELLVNISSGTPAMKSCLIVLATLCEYTCKVIQVRTPQKAMNTHTHDFFDNEYYWENDNDRKPDAVSRCDEVKCPDLFYIRNTEIIKEMIRKYDYDGALMLVNNMPGEKVKEFKKMIELASARLSFNWSKALELEDAGHFGFLPVRDRAYQEVFEYALILKIKAQRKEYADYVRALSPLLTDLFDLILKKELKVDVRPFLRNDRGVLKWNRNYNDNRELGDWVFSTLDAAYSHGVNEGPCTAQHLMLLINAKSEDSHLKELVSTLRKVEESVRNLAAHEITYIDNDKIYQKNGIGINGVTDCIREAFAYAGLPINEDMWNSYEQMNEKIIARIS